MGGSPSGELLYFTSFGLQPSQGRSASNILSGFRGRTRGTLAEKSVAGAIATELAAESVCFLLKHLIGTPTTTGASAPFTHAFEGVGACARLPDAGTEHIHFTGFGQALRGFQHLFFGFCTARP